MTKVCGRCKTEKDITEFGVDKRNKDGLNRVCKVCKRELDKEYNDRHKDQRREASKQWAKNNPDKIVEQTCRRKDFLWSLKQPCIKCGEDRPSVIEFHHIDPTTKLFNISRVTYNGARTKRDVIEEVKKCVCLCANCHADFHYLYGKNPSEPKKKLDEYISL